jgi:hypothetical protein
VPVYTRVYMAKLYWRVKRDGKWTWVAAQQSSDAFTSVDGKRRYLTVLEYQEETV